MTQRRMGTGCLSTTPSSRRVSGVVVGVHQSLADWNWGGVWEGGGVSKHDTCRLSFAQGHSAPLTWCANTNKSIDILSAARL